MYFTGPSFESRGATRSVNGAPSPFRVYGPTPARGWRGCHTAGVAESSAPILPLRDDTNEYRYIHEV